MVTNNMAAFMKTLACPRFFSKKCFPKKRWTPLAAPIIDTATKIIERETNVEAVPIISGVVTFDKINQKKYPKKTLEINSMNKNAVLFPTSIFLNFIHLL